MIRLPAGMSATELTLRVTLTKKQLRKAIYYNLLRTPWFWGIFAVPLVLIFFPLNLDPGGRIGAIIGGIVFILLVPYSATRASLKNPAVLAPIVLTFSDSGVSTEFINGKSSANWSLVKGASEAIGFIFVKMQRGSFHLIPKDQINAEQAEQLRQILREHLIKENVSLGN